MPFRHFVLAFLEFVQVSKESQAGSNIALVGTLGFLENSQRTLVERLCQLVLALPIVQQTKVIQARGDIGMVGA